MSALFYKLGIGSLRRETDHAVVLTFDVPEALRGAFDFKAGQHLTLRKLHHGQDIRRNYSLCVAPHEGALTIAIKHIEGGVFSSFALFELKVGETLEVMPAMGRFVWDFVAASQRRYVGIAAGSGITPVLSLLKTALATEPSCQFTLLYGNRTSQSIMFLEELAELKNTFMHRLAVHHFLSAEEDEVALFNGRLDAAKFDEIFTNLVDPSLVDAFFICGPSGMMDAAERVLLSRGVEKSKILSERFTAERPNQSEVAAQSARAHSVAGLTFTAIFEGRRRTIAFDPAQANVLGSVHAAGLAAPFACKSGVCATCRARLMSGQVEMAKTYGLSAAEIEQGYILTCQSIPLSMDLVIDYDG